MVPWSSQFKNYISSIPVLRKLRPFPGSGHFLPTAVPQSPSTHSAGGESRIDEDFRNNRTNANQVNDSMKMPSNLTHVDSVTSPANKKSFFKRTDPSSNVDRNGSVSNFSKDPFTTKENKNIHINVAESTVERRPSIRYSNLHPNLYPNRTSSVRSCRRLKQIRNVNNAKLVPVSRFPFGCSVHVIDNSKNITQRSSNVATVSSLIQNDMPFVRRGRNKVQTVTGMHGSQNISRSLSEKLLSVKHNPVFEASRHSSDTEHSFKKGTLI